MTKDAIWQEYLEREAAANAPGGPGADVEAIIRKLAADAGETYETVREVVISRSFSRSAG